MDQFSRRQFITRSMAIASAVSIDTHSLGAFAGQNAASVDGALPFLMPSDFEELDVISWRVEQGKQDPNNPLLEPLEPWDQGCVFGSGSVLRDPLDGKWKSWQSSVPAALAPVRAGSLVYPERFRLTYAESADGARWEKPKLSLVPWQGRDSTNILMDTWCLDESVNIDPHRDWPYEMFSLTNPSYGNGPGTLPGMPLAPGQKKLASGLYRFRSRDGKAWQAWEGPIKLDTSDDCMIYRQPDGTYVAYHKLQLPAFPGGLNPGDIADGGLRVIGRRTSSDGSAWSDPTELVMTPDWRDPADTQFMKLCPVARPGGYIAILTVYHNFIQAINLQWTCSRDGVTWWRPDRRPCLPNPPLGDYGGGMIWPAAAPIVDENRLHVYYGGMEGNHGDLFNTKGSGPRKLLTRGGEALTRQSSSLPDNGAFCRATWTIDRLWAMVCAAGGLNVGAATTVPMALGQKQLWVNFVTLPRGELRVELLTREGKPVPGFAGEDCLSLQGDHHTARVQWKIDRPIPVEATRIRFFLRRAFLYGFEARDRNSS